MDAIAVAAPKSGNLALRVISGTVMVAAASIAWTAGGWWLLAILIAASFACAVEWVRLSSGRAWTRIVPTAVAASLAATILSSQASPLAGLVFALACVPLAAAGARLSGAAMPLVTGFGIGYAAAFAASLFGLAFNHAGALALPWLAAVVWGSDIGGYVVGRLVGGPRLAPRISPGKTWSGLVGAMSFGAVAGAAASALGANVAPPLWAALFGAALGLVGQMGDLAESSLKRRAGVKDSSRLIPGHGGALDRLDAAMATAPCLLLAMEAAVWIR